MAERKVAITLSVRNAQIVEQLIVKKVCGVLVLLGGIYTIYAAP